MTSRNDWNAQKILYLALASLMQVLYPGGIGILSVGFCVGRKPETPNKKNLEARQEPTTNSTHISHRGGIEPRPHWWEASALTATSSLLSSTLEPLACCWWFYSSLENFMKSVL